MEEVAVVPGEAEVSTSESRDPERFYCPHLGCNRSFAELWRLKVHYRAPPDVRGSGKERGHGTELEFCPKCNKDLKPGKHHVGCSASKRQSKRTRQGTEHLPGQDASLAARASLGSDVSHDFRPKPSSFAAEDHSNVWAPSTSLATAHNQQPHQPPPQHSQQPQHHYPQHYPLPAAYSYAGPNGMPMSMWPMPGSMHHPPFAVMLPHGSIHPYAMPQLMAMHGHPSLPQFHAEPQPSSAPAMVSAAPTPAIAPPVPVEQQRNSQLAGMFDDEEVELARVPSPPPLPPDFAAQQNSASTSHGMLFNFGQFAQRMPVSQPQLTGANKLVKDLTQEAMDLAESNVVYETHDDGDLMELLFGVADEMPTMATFHLHTFASSEAQQEAAQQSVATGDMQPFNQGNGTEQQEQEQAHQQQEQEHQQQEHQQHQQHQHQEQQQQQQQQQQPAYRNGVHSNGSAPEPLSTCHVKHEQPHAVMPKGVVALKQEHPSAQQLDECFQLSGEHYEPCGQLARAAQPGIGLV